MSMVQQLIAAVTNAERQIDEQMMKLRIYEQVVDERKAALEMAKKAILEQIAKKEKLRRFMNALALCDEEATEFQDEVFTLAIDRILVEKGDKGKLVFCFTDGSEISERIDG